MNRVVYVFADGTETCSYREANEWKEEKGNYKTDFRWEDMPVDAVEGGTTTKSSTKFVKSKVKGGNV